MRRSLYSEYEQLLSSGYWKYYPFNTLSMDIFSDGEAIRHFFISYLGKGEKADLPIFEFLNTLSEDRLQHTFSCFLLGLLLYDKCDFIYRGINDSLCQIPISNNETLEERFKYLWMLVSIFHDFGYAIENKDEELSKEQFDSLMTKFPRRPKLIPDLYSKKLLKNYEKYKICKFGVYDHGICGGLKLYSDLCQLRDKKESISDSEHYWGKDLISNFSLAAWIVACHNIWLVEENNKNAECYRCLELNKLLYKGNSREIKKSPFLFLLCFVDSIEPIKILHNFGDFNEITIIFRGGKLLMCKLGSLCEAKWADLSNHIGSLQNWLCDIEQRKDSIIIKF